MIRRRLPLVLLVLVLGLLVALYLAVTSPRVYEGISVIQVEAPAIIDPESDAGVPAARRVQLIEQRLMVRANIIDMIERHRIYTALPLSLNEKVALLRQSTRIDSVAATGRDSGGMVAAPLSAIVITVQAETAQKAADLANDFAASIINQDEIGRHARIQETRSFLTAMETRIEQELEAHEGRLADYRMQNEDSLPSSQEHVLSEIARLNEQESVLDREIMALERERLAIQAADSTIEGRPAGSLAQQLRSAELELAQARRTFAADHPEIARLEENIRRLNQGGLIQSSPIVDDQINLIDAQLEQLRRQRVMLSERQAAIDAARGRMAEVMREVEALTREQRRLQDSYAETSRRLAEVEMLRSLQESNQTERLVVLEPAVPPEFPAMSGRKKSAILGGFASVMAALGLSFLLELRKPVLRSSGQFMRATGLRPVVELAYIPNASDLARQRRARTQIALIAILGTIAAIWLTGYLPGVPSPGVVGPMGSGG